MYFSENLMAAVWYMSSTHVREIISTKFLKIREKLDPQNISAIWYAKVCPIMCCRFVRGFCLR